MTAHGIIIAKNNNTALIRIGKSEGCNGCNQCGKLKDSSIHALDITDAIIGDEVEIDINDKIYDKSVLLLYVMPCLAFTIGIICAYYILLSNLESTKRDIMSLVIGVICAAVAYCCIFACKKHFDKQYVAVVIKVIKNIGGKND